MGNNTVMELDSISADNPVVEAATSKLPSWLRTDPVKLVPLNKLIHEREMIHKMAQGKISAKIYKEEHMKEGPSPHQLAMHAVHVAAQEKQGHKEELAEKPRHRHEIVRAPRSASEKAQEENFDSKQASAIKHALRIAREKASAKHNANGHKHHARHHIVEENSENHQTAPHVGKTAHVVSVALLKKKLLEEKDELKLIEQGEAHRIAMIKKQELHKLAMLKRKDHIEELKLNLGIQEIEKKLNTEKSQGHQQQPQQSEVASEKAKIKAEMARIEEEEHEKLAGLKAKLEKVQTRAHAVDKSLAGDDTDNEDSK